MLIYQTPRGGRSHAVDATTPRGAPQRALCGFPLPRRAAITDTAEEPSCHRCLRILGRLETTIREEVGRQLVTGPVLADDLRCPLCGGRLALATKKVVFPSQTSSLVQVMLCLTCDNYAGHNEETNGKSTST